MSNTWQELTEIQPEAMLMLKNSITKDRVAHAYLLEGEKGTGKKAMGIAFAKSLLCQQPSEGYLPCEQCSNCRRIKSGNHPDVHLVEPEGLSIKKEQIKNLQEEFTKKSVEANRKIYTIVAADRMSVQAANSLLKFLEEPQSETVAILMTEQIQRMLPTILSRCQIIKLRPLSPQNVKKKLMEHDIDSQTASIVSFITQNLEEGLRISAEEWFAQAQKIVLKLYEVLQSNPMRALVYLQEEWFLHFKEKEQLDRGLDVLFLIYKDLLYIQLDKRNLVIFQNKLGEFESHALQISQKRLADKMGHILEAKRKLMSNTNPQLLMEQLVLNLQEGSSFV
ncbi:DNA polymerase III subunit delta' [Peribacillus glennii]|uniref:DNA polymerase III subunit delta' n=1 Tax=Peribacillus glennii TaxID=2303991 RepID=A0A372LAG0_9BACI|nr:DNA polymerase III subunit delta' [Peribacillus glennii]RFU62627.1 DNA polymerase III subunit delta' [Peribacillus glennii]